MRECQKKQQDFPSNSPVLRTEHQRGKNLKLILIPLGSLRVHVKKKIPGLQLALRKSYSFKYANKLCTSLCIQKK